MLKKLPIVGRKCKIKNIGLFQMYQFALYNAALVLKPKLLFIVKKNINERNKYVFSPPEMTLTQHKVTYSKWLPSGEPLWLWLTVLCVGGLTYHSALWGENATAAVSEPVNAEHIKTPLKELWCSSEARSSVGVNANTFVLDRWSYYACVHKSAQRKYIESF